MTDYTKLIERLRDDTARHDDESRRFIVLIAPLVIEIGKDIR